MHMSIETNKDIDIFNAQKHNRPKELQIEPKNAYLDIHMNMNIFLPVSAWPSSGFTLKFGIP